MLIAIEDYLFYGVMGVSVLLFIISIGIFMAIKNNAPDAMTHWQAKREGKPICRVHFKGRKVLDCIAEIDKAEKEIGTPYWTVPKVGIKFKPEPDEIEFIEGSLPCVNYFENVAEGQKLAQVVAYSQMKDYFKKIGFPIEGVEDIAFYVASEMEKLSDSARAIANAKIESAETKKYIQRFLQVIEANKAEIRNKKLESGVFTWQTSMKAIEGVIAYGSANIARTKETIRAAIMRQEENKRKDYIMYAIVAFILAIAAAAVIVVTQK